jgi:hypothetical protein
MRNAGTARTRRARPADMSPRALVASISSHGDGTQSLLPLSHRICMRIILSHGKVNIFNLTKNAGTCVEQIERFYAKHLPLFREMAKNLQSFGRRRSGEPT